YQAAVVGVVEEGRAVARGLDDVGLLQAAEDVPVVEARGNGRVLEPDRAVLGRRPRPGAARKGFGHEKGKADGEDQGLQASRTTADMSAGMLGPFPPGAPAGP